MKGSEQGERWIIIDEVQKIPQILDVVHVGIQRHKIKFALTGSSARKLKRGSANLLAARALSYRMHPMTYRELGERFDLENYLHWGGLPNLLELEKNEDRRKFLNTYVDTYLREEIQIEQLVRKIEPFRMFLDVVGQVNGEVVNMARIAREADIDAKSAERYFSILEDTQIGWLLPSYNRSIRKAQLKHPKFYLFDVGVARALKGEISLALEMHTGAYGHCFEHFVIQQALALNDYLEKDFTLSYLRTKDGVEVDLVLTRPGKSTLFVEIKSTDRPEILNLKNLKALADEAEAIPIVLCNAQRAVEVEGVHAMPWAEGLDWAFE